MSNLDTTQNTSGFNGLPGLPQTIPALLIAHTAPGTFNLDRCALLKNNFSLGRDPSCELTAPDSTVSKQHFRIYRKEERYMLEDLGSTNGTFVNGERVAKTVLLDEQSIIRAGKTLLVFLGNGAELLHTPSRQNYGMAGRFYTSSIIEHLKMAALSGRHILITGPSGTGKELAANALCHMFGQADKPLKLISYNAARFSSGEEATTTLFGVGARVFSNVDARQGLIEQAHNGALFLDEVHNLPERVQRSLLRVIEDGLTSRIGENNTRPCNTRFILASNQEGPTRGLAHDLFARLRMVQLPPLSERRADIPSIFDTVLDRALKAQQQDPAAVQAILRAKHYEALCLDGFPLQNIRGLIDVAERIASYLAIGRNPEEALIAVFDEVLSHKIMSSYAPDNRQSTRGSKYEQNKDLIIKLFYEKKENLSATERALKARGILCSRRWLREFLKKWDIGEYR